MEAEASKTALYLLLVLGGGFMVGVLAILFIISIATFGAWLAILISSARSPGRIRQAYVGYQCYPMLSDRGRKRRKDS